MKKTEIKLANRYATNNHLEYIKEKKGKYYYKLVLEDPEWDFMRVVAGEDNNFNFPEAVDPSGGPFMRVGCYNTEHMVLVKILNRKGCPIIMVFENEKS